MWKGRDRQLRGMCVPYLDMTVVNAFSAHWGGNAGTLAHGSDRDLGA